MPFVNDVAEQAREQIVLTPIAGKAEVLRHYSIASKSAIVWRPVLKN
jgi:hypothetical protein